MQVYKKTCLLKSTICVSNCIGGGINCNNNAVVVGLWHITILLVGVW
jgi:hypothetical protein